MKDFTGLLRIGDIDGLNYMTLSNLKQLEFKKIEEAYSIKYVSEGTEFYRVDQKDKEVSSRNFLLTNPKQEVEGSLDSSTYVSGVCYFFNPKLIRQIKSSLNQSLEQNLDNISSEENVELNFTDINTVDNIPIHKFHTELSKHLSYPTDDVTDKLEVSAYLMLLAESLVTHKANTLVQLNDLKSQKTTTKTELYRRIQLGRQFIHDNVDQFLSLQDIAQAACLSEYYFHRTFRNFFHLTPHQYHNSIRMQRAHELILQKDYPKKEAAFECGFMDVKYFSKSYSKWLNLNQHN